MTVALNYELNRDTAIDANAVVSAMCVCEFVPRVACWITQLKQAKCQKAQNANV